MTRPTIITIGRQFGSGGHEIGEMLAKKLDVPFYDRNLVKMVAEKLNIAEGEVETLDEARVSSVIASYAYPAVDYHSFLTEDMFAPIDGKLYRAQTAVIRSIARKGPCVIIGRCADYILRDYPNCLSVFICASKEDRVYRIKEQFYLSEREAVSKMKKIDRERKYYYETHTGKEWGSIDSHDMMFNSSRLGREKIADMLAALCR